MNIYFYCTYEHSKQGFFPSYLSENKLAPIDESKGITFPKAVWNFFSYDEFLVLWRDYPNKDTFLFPEPSYGIFGLRSLEGHISERKAVLNMAILADEEEASLLEGTALVILQHYKEFTRNLFEWMSLGGDCGYQLDGEQLISWLQENICQNNSRYSTGNRKLDRILNLIGKREEGLLISSDLLRFAVYTTDWKSAATHMGKSRIWKIHPKRAISQKEFQNFYR